MKRNWGLKLRLLRLLALGASFSLYALATTLSWASAWWGSGTLNTRLDITPMDSMLCSEDTSTSQSTAASKICVFSGDSGAEHYGETVDNCKVAVAVVIWLALVLTFAALLLVTFELRVFLRYTGPGDGQNSAAVAPQQARGSDQQLPVRSEFKVALAARRKEKLAAKNQACAPNRLGPQHLSTRKKDTEDLSLFSRISMSGLEDIQEGEMSQLEDASGEEKVRNIIETIAAEDVDLFVSKLGPLFPSDPRVPKSAHQSGTRIIHVEEAGGSPQKQTPSRKAANELALVRLASPEKEESEAEPELLPKIPKLRDFIQPSVGTPTPSNKQKERRHSRISGVGPLEARRDMRLKQLMQTTISEVRAKAEDPTTRASRTEREVQMTLPPIRTSTVNQVRGMRLVLLLKTVCILIVVMSFALWWGVVIERMLGDEESRHGNQNFGKTSLGSGFVVYLVGLVSSGIAFAITLRFSLQKEYFHVLPAGAS